MKKIVFCCVLVIISILLIYPSRPQAETLQEQLDKKAQEIKELEQKVADLQTQTKTLNSQIAFMNGQIQLTLLKISQTEEQVLLLTGKIDRLETSLSHFSKILENRIAQTYRSSRVDSFMLLLSSEDLSSFVLRYKYLKIIQNHDRKLIEQIAQTQSNYQDQKTEEESLKSKLEVQKKLLGQQIKEKQRLLEITKNDEKKFQALLISAKSEQEAIKEGMRAAKLENGTSIAKGDVVGIIGNSGAPGCSSGPHLHFEVVKNGQHQNPAEYLKSINIAWNNQPDPQFSFSGNWDFPIENPRITQGFGMTYWARLGWYSGGPHTGIDMVSDNQIIKSPQSGILYRGNISCKGSTMNYIAIDHGGGLFTWYWHVK